MIGQDINKLLLVLWLEQVLNGAAWQLCKGFVSRSKDSEWTFAYECVDQACGLDCCQQCFELLGRSCDFRNVLVCWKDDRVDNVNDSVIAFDISSDNLGAIDHDG